MIERPLLSLALSPLLTGLAIGIVNKGFNVLLRSEIDRLFLKYQEDLPFFPALGGSYWRQHEYIQINPSPSKLILREQLFIQEVSKATFTVRVLQNVLVTVTAVASSILLVPEIAKSSGKHRVIYSYLSGCISVLAVFCTTDLSLSKLEKKHDRLWRHDTHFI